MMKVMSFIKDAVEEVRYKVSWPLYNKLQSSSVMVLVAAFIFALVIGFIDLVLKNAVSWIYSAS